MRLAILILLFPVILSAQIWKGNGISYVSELPTHDPGMRGAWVVVDTLTGQWYERDQTAGIWREMGARLQATNTYGVPSYTPSKQRGRLAINSGDSLYYYQAGTWTHINDVGSVDLTPYVEYADSLTTFVTPTMLDDTSAAIRGDFPVNTDNQTLSIDSTSVTGGRQFTLSIQNGNSVTFIDSIGSGGGGGGGSHVQYSDSLTVFVTPSQLEDSLATIPDSIVTGSGVANYLARWSGSSTLDTTGVIWTGGRLGIAQTNPTARLHITGSGSTSATTALLVENSTGTDILEVKDGGDLLINGAITAGYGGGQVTSNVAFGNLALSGTPGANNVAIGSESLRFSTGATNLGIGALSLRNNLAGSDNIGIGYRALNGNTIGSQNTAIGSDALLINTEGTRNVAIGYRSMVTNTIGNFNTVIGWNSLRFATTTSNNTAIGYESLINITTGGSNTAIGFRAGKFISDGVTANQTSNSSLYIGQNTMALANGGANETVIGPNAIGLGSNTNVLGNSSSTQTHLWGGLTIGSTTTKDASAVADFSSTTQGFLPPRLTTVQRDAISSPANGLIIFCSDCTATDGSTGVSQTYSSSSWRNHY